MTNYITGENQELSTKVDIEASLEFRLEAALLKIEQLTVEIEDLEKLNESAEMLVEGYRQKNKQLQALKLKADEICRSLIKAEKVNDCIPIIERAYAYLEAAKELNDVSKR